LARQVPRFEPVARFQAVERDIAVLVAESVTHDALMQAIWAAPCGGILRDAVLFDIYRPKPQAGADASNVPLEKSMAVRLTLNAQDATLSEQQIEDAVVAVLATLSEKVAARQRA
jgi:phenylalanyl-tRNA synthetase beta chain